jgi:hypothetical protein
LARPGSESDSDENLAITSAVAATVATTPAAPAAASASTATTASAPAATTSTAVPATPAASPAATFALRASFIHNERTAEKILAIERCNGLFSFGVIFDFGEAETARLARKTIAKQCEGIGLNPDFREQCLYLLFRSLERQVAHVQFLHGRSPCVPHLRLVPTGQE